MFNKERLEERQKIRAEIARHTSNPGGSSLLLISESLDDYIELKIQTDKVLEGIFKDLQGSFASMAESGK